VVQQGQPDDIPSGNNNIGAVQGALVSRCPRLGSDHQRVPPLWRDECVVVEYNIILLAKSRIPVQPLIFLGEDVREAREAIDKDGFHPIDFLLVQAGKFRKSCDPENVLQIMHDGADPSNHA